MKEEKKEQKEEKKKKKEEEEGKALRTAQPSAKDDQKSVGYQTRNDEGLPLGFPDLCHM